jgi:hypothetical protein
VALQRLGGGESPATAAVALWVSEGVSVVVSVVGSEGVW